MTCYKSLVTTSLIIKGSYTDKRIVAHCLQFRQSLPRPTGDR